jgi:hypothetical protein
MIVKNKQIQIYTVTVQVPIVALCHIINCDDDLAIFAAEVTKKCIRLLQVFNFFTILNVSQSVVPSFKSTAETS